MDTTRKQNLLVYRDNDTWRALEADLRRMASTGYRGEPANLTVQIFPEGTEESVIAAWATENRDLLNSDGRVICDGTARHGILNARVMEHDDRLDDNIDECVGRAVETFLRRNGLAPTDLYRKIFALVTGETGTRRVQIVLDHLSDYNPLRIAGFEEPWRFVPRKDEVRYGEAFAELLPVGTTVECIGLQDLQLPDEQTLVLCHHHALNGLRGDRHDQMRRCPRILMPYPSGLLKTASVLCDLSSVVQGDILEEVRIEIRGEIR